MVSVPVYQRDVRDRPALQQGLTVRASGEDLGAGIGRGIQQIGQGLGQAGDAYQKVRDLEDMTRAKEADSQLAEWSRNAMYGEGGFMTLEGKAAVDGRSEFEKAFEEQRKLIGGKLTGGASIAYNNASVARRNSVFESSIVHTANQRKAWIKQASADRISTFGEDALANFSDPSKVDFNIAAGQAELRQQAELEGWDTATLAKNERDYISGVRKAIVMRMAVDDPLAAKTYADRFAEQLTGPARADIAATLDASVKDELSKAAAAKIMGIDPLADMSPDGRSEANAAPVKSVEDQLAEIEDDDVRELTRRRISAAQSLQNSAREAEQKEAKSSAFEFIIQGGSPDDLPLEVKSAIGVEGMGTLWTYYEKQATGEHRVSDPETLYSLTQWAAIDPAAFAKYDLNDVRLSLSPADHKALMEKQASSIANIRKAREDGAPLASAFSLANDALAAVGISRTGLKDAELATANKRIALFQNTLAGQVSEFMDKEGRKPNDDEIQSMVNRLLLPVVMKKTTAYNPLSLNPFDAFSFGGTTSSRDGFLFEAGSRADNETVDVTVTYEDIPIDFRDAIAADLELPESKGGLGRKPSPEEVTARYELFLLNR